MCCSGEPSLCVVFFLGLTDVNFYYVLFLSGVARLPSIITSTLGGDALGVQKYATAIVVFVITLAVSGIGVLIYKKVILWRQKD